MSNLRLLLSVYGPLLRQRLDNSAIEHRSIDPRERDLVGQILGKQRDHVAVPIAVQARRVLELRVLVAAVRVFGYRKLEMERYEQAPKSEPGGIKGVSLSLSQVWG